MKSVKQFSNLSPCRLCKILPLAFPAGILQFPAFALNSPKYIYYPRIGAAIGHEITHGYDDEGTVWIYIFYWNIVDKS